ncbi:Hypothetical predicted protein [Podarcis lilfordi]|uniref:Uncharacterized protein n=1 Tax=Podarcis lilfordi TaxID=74358 RepID=A0AA35KH41_9SAUR|nr:Hypothetical predicted protein [Podarcis lilfordi]
MQCAPRLTWRPAQIEALASGPPNCRSRTWRGTRPAHPWADSQTISQIPCLNRGFCSTPVVAKLYFK